MESGRIFRSFHAVDIQEFNKIMVTPENARMAPAALPGVMRSLRKIAARMTMKRVEV